MATSCFLEASWLLVQIVACVSLVGHGCSREVITLETWQTQLNDTLQSMYVLAGNSSHAIPQLGVSVPEVAVLRTAAISAPENWTLVALATQILPSAVISEASPICLVIPRASPDILESTSDQVHFSTGPGPTRGTTAELGAVSASVLVSSRLLHAARMVRLARDFTVQRMGLPGLSHKRHPRIVDERPILFHVYTPDEFGTVLQRVVEDESWGWTFRGSATNLSSVTGFQTPSSSDEVRSRTCSFGVWGFSSKGGWNDKDLAAFLFNFQVGIEVDLDSGDVTPPKAFNPSWYQGKQSKYGKLVEMPSSLLQGTQTQLQSSQAYTVVTAFSKNHFKIGLRLLNSILTHGPQSSIPFTVVTYTMEHMSRVAHAQVLCIAEQFKKAGIPLVLRSYNFDRIPLWMFIRHYKAGWWAWKGIMVWETFLERGGSVLWLDAGDAINSPVAIPSTFAALDERGFVGISEKWFGENWRWCRPESSLYLGIDVSPHSPQCCGCLFGVTPKTYASILRPFYECSMTLQCIAPHGSNMGNHRQDQAILSVLASWSGFTCSGAHTDILWKCDSHRNDCSKPATGEAANACSIT